MALLMVKKTNYMGYTKIQDLMGYDERERLRRASLNYKNAKEWDIQKASPSSDIYNLQQRKAIAEKAYGRQVVKAYSDFAKTPLGKVAAAKSLINDGRNYISKFLSNAAKKLKTDNDPYADLSKRDPGVELR